MSKSIKKDVREGAKDKVYLVWGDEKFLRDYYKTALIDKVLDKDFADFNFKQYTTKKPDNDEIESFMSSYPCMSDKKIVYIKDSGLFKKISESDKKFWTEFLKELPDFAIIIFSILGHFLESFFYSSGDSGIFLSYWTPIYGIGTIIILLINKYINK